MTEPRELAKCAEHGLAYDPSIHSGCVVCRRSGRPLPPAPPTRKSRASLYFAIASIVAVIGLSVGGYVFYTRARAKAAARAEARVAAKKDDDALREQRQTPLASLAPVPLPTAIPLAGPMGTDADGYPTQYVDRPALRSLLWHRKLTELTGYVERFQTDFESDPKREYWAHDAATAFESAEPDLAGSLDEWVKATPESFAPYLGRAAYWIHVAYARRGGKAASETSAASFAAMREAMRRGLADLDRVIAIRPKVVTARRLQIVASRATSDDDLAKLAIDEAIAVCPTCYLPRRAYLFGLEPRWGGSYAAMDAFARAAPVAANAKLRFLAGYVDFDKASAFAHDESKYDDALAAIQRACAIGDDSDFLLERARIRGYRNENPLALADLDRAAALRPGEPSILFRRARANGNEKLWERAGRDLLAGMRIDAADEDARAVFDWIVQGIDYEAWTHFKAGHKDDALRLYDLLHELAPTNADINARRTAAVSGNPTTPPSNDDVAALEAALKTSPDDRAAYQRLDYALARQGQFDRVVAMWTEYIARHPGDGTAYLERGGANFHLRKLPEAHSDAAKACELGVTEGCARAKQIAAMMK